MGDKGYSSFQKSPIRGRPNVGKLVPKKLTRTTTDDSQTAINRVVHEALARGGTVSSPEVAEEVQQRVALVLQAKEDELTGKITHQQRLQLIKLVATLSAEEYFEEARRLQSSARQDAEQKVISSSMLPVVWRRMLCSYFLGQEEVLGLGACCRFLRQDHALGLQSFVLPSHLEGLEDTVSTAPLAMKPLPLPSLKRLVSKFRYAQKLVCGARCCRLQDSDLELLPLAQLRVLDLSFCYNLSEEKLLEGLRSTLCLADLSLRGCSQLTSPGTEEVLADLKGLASLDVRGCSNLCSESLMRMTAENLKPLTTLRFGYTCTPQLWPEHQAMPLETFSSEAFAALGSSHSRLQCLELDIGLMARWVNRAEARVVDDAVVSLLCLKHLQALMLWNCKDLQPMTFRRILDRLGDDIDTVGIDDCYHEHDAYFHVIPSDWGIRTAQDLDKGLRSEAMLPPSGSKAGRAVLIGQNVARDPQVVLANTVQPLVDKGCQPTVLVLHGEGEYDGIIQLASDRTAEIELLTSINVPDGFLENFCCSMLKRCPLLRRLGIRTKGAMMSLGQLCGYEALLKVLAGHCQQLEVFDTWLITSFESLTSRQTAVPSVGVEYYDGNPNTAGGGASPPSVHYDTLRDFFGSCPRLAAVRLIMPAAAQDRLAFWRFCSDAGFPQSSLILGQEPTPRNLPRPVVEVEAEELKILRQVDPAPVTELAIMKGCPLTTAMAGEILRFTQLRRLGLQQMHSWPVLRELLVPLAEHCPDLEELWLGDIIVSEEEGEVFVEALQRFKLRSLHVGKLVPESVEQMLVQALPGLVQQNRRTLQSLACSGELGSHVLCSLAAKAPQLRSLSLRQSWSKDKTGKDKELCSDFAGSQEELLLKLVARRPKLEELVIAWVRPPDNKQSEEQERRTLSQVLHQGPKLVDLGCTNVSFYTGLQYNDGHEHSPEPDSDDSDDSD